MPATASAKQPKRTHDHGLKTQCRVIEESNQEESH
jgi:hypothetical protein